MEGYKHILLAVDFSDEDSDIADKAKSIADKYQAKLSIVHVVDSVPIIDAGYGMDISSNIDISSELMACAKARMSKLADELAVAENNRWLETGSAKQEIVRVAEQNKVDLIIVGSHGRHGLALLLGSTANSVLHHAPCDVLAVRLRNN